MAAAAKYPIDETRVRFPALKREYKGRTVAYFDGPGGAQALREVIDAMVAYMEAGSANIHCHFPSSEETMEKLDNGRKAIAALFNASPDEVSYGANATTIMFQAARALMREWKAGDEIVLTEMEHHSNIDAWRTAAEDKGVTVKCIPVNPETLTLDLGALPGLLNGKTRLVAVGGASNVIGTVNDVKEVARQAHAAGALVAVDAVHAIPHFFVDREDLGIDLLFASSYKFFGPHMGMSVIRKEILERMRVYKVAPASAAAPEKSETGTQNLEAIAALPATVDFIAGFGSGATLTDRVRAGYARIEEYENMLGDMLREGLRTIPGVTLYQAGPSVKKTPTIAFRVDGMKQSEFCTRMSEGHSIFVSDGDFYAQTLVRKIVPGDEKSVVRAGIAPYNTVAEVQALLDATRKIMNG